MFAGTCSDARVRVNSRRMNEGVHVVHNGKSQKPISVAANRKEGIHICALIRDFVTMYVTSRNRRKDSQPETSQVQPLQKRKGFVNRKNICYMNSCLQVRDFCK